MNLKVYCVYDCKAENFGMPFVMESRGDALREWYKTVNTQGNKINEFPADFTLFEIAEWNKFEGTFSLYPTKLNLGTGVEFVKQLQPVAVDPANNGSLNKE